MGDSVQSAYTLSPHSEAILAAHQFQGQTNDCVPFSIAMVANGLRGLNVDGKELGQEMNRVHWRGMLPVIYRMPNWAAFPWGMTAVLKDYGFPAKWRLLQNAVHLVEKIKSGDILLPIIGRWRPLWAHVMVLLAHHPELGWGFANPAHAKGELYWLRHAGFERQWRAMGKMIIEAHFA